MKKMIRISEADASALSLILQAEDSHRKELFDLLKKDMGKAAVKVARKTFKL
jgi:hypothetical protein